MRPDTQVIRANTRAMWTRSRQRMHARVLPTMREFAESQVVLPDGPHAGQRFNCERQPFAGFWFDAVDSGLWPRCVFAGPNQCGKSLLGSVVPVLYHLFGVGETVVFGVPSKDFVNDKWNDDLLPAIEASPSLRRLLPEKGPGSRGGTIRSDVRFKNGATLRFMTGGGRDAARAGKTSRVVVITEVDAMDESSSTSRESDKISQLEARTLAFRRRKRIYLEGTYTLADARLDREYRDGTQSRIAQRCPHCECYTTLERDHLVGWRDAETKLDASARSHWVCPECGVMWSEADRRAAAEAAVLVHRGQEVEQSGTITGDAPRTDTLGFRVSAPDNFFADAGDVGADEWASGRDPDEENAERRMCQQTWAKPYRPPGMDRRMLSVASITARAIGRGRGSVPEHTHCITVGADLGKYLIHWLAQATLEDGSPHIVDYGAIEVPTDSLGLEPALRVALAQLRDLCEAGWSDRAPDQVWVDSNWQTDVVHEFVKGAGDAYRATQGEGANQPKRRRYAHKKARTKVIRFIGDEYHIVRLKERASQLVHINADYWKGYVHERFLTPASEPGGMTLFGSDEREHFALAKHITAEKQVEEFSAGRGVVTVFQTIRRNNHWLDCCYLASAAAHYAGARLEGCVTGAHERAAAARQRGQEYLQQKRGGS